MPFYGKHMQYDIKNASLFERQIISSFLCVVCEQKNRRSNIKSFKINNLERCIVSENNAIGGIRKQNVELLFIGNCTWL